MTDVILDTNIFCSHVGTHMVSFIPIKANHIFNVVAHASSKDTIACTSKYGHACNLINPKIYSNIIIYLLLTS